MRSSVSVRAPQAIGSRVHTKPRHHAGLHLIQGGLPDGQEFQRALEFCLYFLNLFKRREPPLVPVSVPVTAGELATTAADLTQPKDWARWEEIRTNKRWAQRAAMSPESVEAFNQQIATLQAADANRLSKEVAYVYRRMRVSEKALGGFVRHYFGYMKHVNGFCEWMSESPVFRKSVLMPRYGVSRFKGLSDAKAKRAVRSEMRGVLTSMLRALVAIRVSAAHRDKIKNEQAEMRILNESTRERFCAVVDLDMEIVLAFYPESEMNGRRHKAPRQLDHRLQRYH